LVFAVRARVAVSPSIVRTVIDPASTASMVPLMRSGVGAACARPGSMNRAAVIAATDGFIGSLPVWWEPL
jgi:hypothetical protein